MRVRVTVYYGDEARMLTRETKECDVPSQEEDEDSFLEASDHLQEMIVETYQDDGYELEPDEDEDSVGIDYIAVWEVPEPFDNRQEAQEFIDLLIEDIEKAISDLE